MGRSKYDDRAKGGERRRVEVVPLGIGVCKQRTALFIQITGPGPATRAKDNRGTKIGQLGETTNLWLHK